MRSDERQAVTNDLKSTSGMLSGVSNLNVVTHSERICFLADRLEASKKVGGVQETKGFSMNAPMEAKKSPEVKPWVRRVVEAVGVFRPANGEEDGR